MFKSISLSAIVNGILGFLGVGFISLSILNILKFQKTLSFIIAVILSTATFIITYIREQKNSKLRVDKNAKNAKKRALEIKLSIMPNDKIIELFKGIFEKMDKAFTVNGDYFEFESFFIFPIFLPNKTSSIFLARALKIADDKNKDIIVVSSVFTDEAIAFAKSTSIKLIGIEEVYSLISKNAPEFILNKVRKSHFNFSLFQTKRYGKRFLIYGVFLNFLSLFVFYPIYYVISGTFFIIYGLSAIFFGKKQEKLAVTFDKIFDEKNAPNKSA